MLSSLERQFSSASIIGSPILIISSFLMSAPFAYSQNGPVNRPPAVSYTAQFKMSTIRTLANGTTIMRETKSVQARDSQWRTYNQQEVGTQSIAGSQSVESIGSISDPVEGTDTNWQSRTHEAVITKLPTFDQRHGCWADDAGTRRMMFDLQTSTTPRLPATNSRTPQQQEAVDLGIAMIEGVEAHGRRITHTIPAGQIGNDQPLVITNELWSAPSLNGLVLKSVNDDPRGGKTTREVTHLDLGEPDPALFQAPRGYEVKVRELHQVPCDQNPR